MKITNFLLCCFLLMTSLSLAQTKSVTGTVVDESGVPLPGAGVLIKNTTNGVSTDFDGNFSITAQSGNVLVISYVGYVTQEVQVTEKSIYNIVLLPDVQQLGEIVILGYGTQKRQDITGAVAVVSAEAFKDRPNTSVGSLIQGQAAGVKVISSSGKPSEGFSVRVRGTNSITAGSDPLYVVDGVPTTDTRSINPADIESVSILKDASSAAIYGAQGANGVVLITTKKGKSDKPVITFDSYLGVSQVWNTLKVLNSEQYRDLMTEFGRTTNWDLYNQNTDWQDVIFQNGMSQNYQVSFSGRNNGTNYYLGAGLVDQEGAVRSAEMRRYNFKLNLSQDMTNWLQVGTNIIYTSYSDVDVNHNNSVNSGGVLLGVLTTPPNIGIYNQNGTFTSNPFQDWENPVASTDGSDRSYKNQRILGNLFAEFKLVEGLKFKSNFGIDYSNARYDYFLDPFRTSYGRAKNGISQYNTYLTNYYIFDNTITWNKQLGNHKIEALAGHVFQKTRWENSYIETNNFAGDQISTPNAGSEIINADGEKSEKANASVISRINYDYAGKYLLTANFRADASSNFGPKERWGYFPSFSAGWRISAESFLENVSAISDLKIRAGWGLVGNDNIGQYAYFGRVGSGSNYPFGGQTMPGTYASSIENLELKWEESEQINVGLDLAMFNNRLRFSADAYVKNTNDLLLNAPLPRGTGFDNAIQNIGKLRNKGLEFQISSVNIDNEDFRWDTDFNISFNRNEVISVVGQEIFYGGIAGRGEVSLVKEGQPLGIFYGYVWGGVDPATGMAYYIDQNGESTFTPSTADRKIIGDANPDFMYGFGNNFTYKNWGLNVFIEGVQGNDVFNASRIDIEGMTDPKNQSAAVLRRWKQPGDVTDIPRALENNTNNSRLSTRFVEDGSYMRFKAVTLSYNLPQTALKQLNISNLKFYVTGENLFTITDYSGFDPEVNAFGASNTTLGVDYGTYPQTRNIIFGLNVTF